ncbi:MAG TPA: TolC family protein, partial [Flavisolibacter sp.]|nr:TolC family protein [Flavisolibacter sp.]
KIQVDVSQRRVQPRIDLNVNLGYNGIYEAATFDQYYRPFIQNIPGVNYSVGLNFGVAPRYDAAKGELATSVALEKQTENQAEALRNNILLNVKQYYDRVRYYSSVVASARQAIRYNETALNNEYTKLKLGSSTVVNVVQVQNNLVFSQTSLNQALEQLNEALLLFRFHTGTLVSSADGEQVSVDYGVIFGLPERP